MITVGNLIKEKRIAKKLSRRKLGEETRIKENFITAIEEEKWGDLPEKTVVSGFIKSLAGALELSVNQAVALFRRDYPQMPVKLNPNPDLPSKFVWSPRLTFAAGSVIVFLAVSLYLFFQYLSFVRAPKLEVAAPSENQVVESRTLHVAGKTDVEATVIVNNQPVVISENGDFETELDVDENTQKVEVKSKSRSGKETVVVRNIDVKLE